MSDKKQDFQSVSHVEIHFKDGSMASAKRFDMTAEAIIEELKYRLETSKTPDWKPIEIAPRFGYFIGFAPLRIGDGIVGPISIQDGVATFNSGLMNRPTHWVDYPKPPKP